MKKLIIPLIALLPLASMAGNPKGTTGSKDVDIKITTNGNDGGHLEIKVDGKDLKKLEEELNKALKNVSIKIDDGSKKHEIHFKAEIKTE